MSDSLTFSLRDLPRALGSMRHFDHAYTVGDDLGTASMRVEPGTVLDLSVDVTSIDNGVLVSVATDVDLVGECVRCLDPVVHHHHVSIADVFADAQAGAGKRAKARDDDEDDDLDGYVIGDHDTIDIEPLLRDAIIPLVDDLPLCSPDCQGLCQDCGVKWVDLPADHRHEVIDPRLASLAALLQPSDGEEGN